MIYTKSAATIALECTLQKLGEDILTK